MKNALIFTILGGFFTLILIYILKEFSPFDANKINELITSNAINPGDWDKLNEVIRGIVDKGLIFQYLTNVTYLAFGVFLAAILSFCTALHLFLDKLFFKSYYDAPSLYNSIRRAVLITAVIGLVIYMRLSVIESSVIILVPVSALIIEIIFISTINPFIRHRMKKINEKVENDKINS